MENIRTDLAIEAHEMCSKEKAEENHLEGIDVKEYEEDGVAVTVIEVKNKQGERILGKPIGKYITIEAPGLKFSNEVYEKACIAVSEQIRAICDITENTKTLVVGLGNKLITPDALGPQVVSKLMVTNHIKAHMKDFLDDSYSSVCAIVPGVLGTTGIETTDIIKGVADKIKPEIVIAVDALASRSIDRISTTVQISDTGINPGSGVENKREGINEESIGAKVIAIGVPTVVDAATIASDSIDMALGDSESLGNCFSDIDKREIIHKALTKNVGNMMVTPKDIDLVIERAAKTVANGINLALHRDLSFEDIESYVG
ncbi:MAG: GPR endopeptidase [Clostridia bacterium]|nr:GPR endopeptidase [Clostridia bacterium]MBP3360218.1 GPR endopeptidase [Clostridia bacterium]